MIRIRTTFHPDRTEVRLSRYIVTLDITNSEPGRFVSGRVTLLERPLGAGLVQVMIAPDNHERQTAIREVQQVKWNGTQGEEQSTLAPEKTV